MHAFHSDALNVSLSIHVVVYENCSISSPRNVGQYGFFPFRNNNLGVQLSLESFPREFSRDETYSRPRIVPEHNATG